MSSYSSDVRTWSWYIALFNVDMGGKKITNLATPTNGADACTKDYVDTLTTDTWSTFPAISNVAMAGFKINNLGAPVVGTDATTKTYVNDQDLLWSTRPAVSNVTMGAYKFDRVDVTGDITNNGIFVTQGTYAQIGGDVNFIGGTSKTLTSNIKIDSNLGTTYIAQDTTKIQFSTGLGDNNCNLQMTAADGTFSLNAKQLLHLASDDSETPSVTLDLSSTTGYMSAYAYGEVYLQGGNGASLLNLSATYAQVRNTTSVEIVADQGTGDFATLQLRTNGANASTAYLEAKGEILLYSGDAQLNLNTNGASQGTAVLTAEQTTVQSTLGNLYFNAPTDRIIVLNKLARYDPIQTPASDGDLATKKYVDDEVVAITEDFTSTPHSWTAHQAFTSGNFSAGEMYTYKIYAPTQSGTIHLMRISYADTYLWHSGIALICARGHIGHCYAFASYYQDQAVHGFDNISSNQMSLLIGTGADSDLLYLAMSSSILNVHISIIFFNRG